MTLVWVSMGGSSPPDGRVTVPLRMRWKAFCIPHGNPAPPSGVGAVSYILGHPANPPCGSLNAQEKHSTLAQNPGSSDETEPHMKLS